MLDPETEKDLIWWKEAIIHWYGAIVRLQAVDVSLTTDATSVAWGAHCMGDLAQRFWNK